MSDKFKDYQGCKTPDGNNLEIFTLKNESGLEAAFMNWGATWLSCLVPAGDGKREVLLRSPGFEAHLKQAAYWGATIGRYANRINGGRFEIDDHQFVTTRNNNGNLLHGGSRGFDRFTWDVAEVSGSRIIFERLSPGGEEGFPGTLKVRATYELAGPSRINACFEAETDAPTPVNLTNHAYFNLSGDKTIFNHTLQIRAAEYLPVDEYCMPPGGLASVGDTPFDFRQARTMEKDDAPQAIDHSFLIRKDKGPQMLEAATLTSPSGDLALILQTEKPALQVYNGEFLGGTPGVDGRPLKTHAGIALEPHFLPDSPNRPDWPHECCILRPDEKYRYRTVYQFTM